MSALNQAFLRAYAKNHFAADAALDQHDDREVHAAHDAPRSVQRHTVHAAHDAVPAAHATFAHGGSASAAPAPERSRPVVEHPLYSARTDVPLPSRPLFATRIAAPPVVPPPAQHASPSAHPAQAAHDVVTRTAQRAVGRPASSGRTPSYEEPTPSPSTRRQAVANSNPPSASRTAARTSPATRTLVPAWEVDEFQWPRGCSIAWEQACDEFAGLGEQLTQVNAHGLRVLGITSVAAHEGRSTLAMCLARAAAAQGLRTLLLDADLENPQLAPALGIDARHDWTEVLGEALPLEEAAVTSVADQLTLLPLLPGTSGRANLLRLPQFAAFVAQLVEVTDLVLVDLPPLESNSLPLARPGHASPLDAVVLVRDVRQTNVAQLREAQRRLDVGGVVSVGVIENFVASAR